MKRRDWVEAILSIGLLLAGITNLLQTFDLIELKKEVSRLSSQRAEENRE